MKITIDGKDFEVSAEKASEVREMLGITHRKLADVAVGDTYFIGDMEFIKFPDANGGSVAVMKNSVFDSEFNDTRGNNFAKSTLFKRLKKEILPKVKEIVGAENVLEFETDLLTLDGLDIYGTMRSKISLPTIDFYRNNRRVFEKYVLGNWWWLVTANSEDTWATCVSPLGYISNYSFNVGFAVRPFFIFDSNILVS